MNTYTNRSDFIQRGPLLPVLSSIAFPLVISNLIQTLFDLSSALWLGQIGVAEFAASNFVWPVTFLFVSIGFGIYVAGAAILARLIGEKQLVRANEQAHQILLLTIMLGLVLGLLGGVFSPAIVDAMRAGPDIRASSIAFLRTSFWGFPFIAVYFAFQAILNAQGRTKEMLLANGLSLLINIVIAPFLIFSPEHALFLPGLSQPLQLPFGAGLGVVGAALSTVIAKAILCGFGLFLTWRSAQSIRLHWRFKPDLSSMRAILRVAIPAMLGQGGAAFGFVVLNAFIEDFGVAVMAAYTLVNRITGLVMQPAMGIGGGLSAIVGQNLGANQPKRVIGIFKTANIVNLVITGIGAMLMFFWAQPMIDAFLQTDADQVKQHAVVYLHYVLPTIPLMGMFSIFQGLFQGSGFTKYSMYMEIGRLWVVRLPLLLVLSNWSDLGARAVWIAMSVSNVVTILYGFYLYRGKHWLAGSSLAGYKKLDRVISKN